MKSRCLTHEARSHHKRNSCCTPKMHSSRLRSRYEKHIDAYLSINSFGNIIYRTDHEVYSCVGRASSVLNLNLLHVKIILLVLLYMDIVPLQRSKRQNLVIVALKKNKASNYIFISVFFLCSHVCLALPALRRKD